MKFYIVQMLQTLQFENNILRTNKHTFSSPETPTLILKFCCSYKHPFENILLGKKIFKNKIFMKFRNLT